MQTDAFVKSVSYIWTRQADNVPLVPHKKKTHKKKNHELWYVHWRPSFHYLIRKTVNNLTHFLSD